MRISWLDEEETRVVSEEYYVVNRPALMLRRRDREERGHVYSLSSMLERTGPPYLA